jgi:hypothetical protein
MRTQNIIMASHIQKRNTKLQFKEALLSVNLYQTPGPYGAALN